MKTMMFLAIAAFVATGAYAQTNSATPMPKPAAPVAKPMAAAAKPKPAKVAAPKAATTGGRMVTTTTSTGKKITYDCSKKGNLNKKACK